MCSFNLLLAASIKQQLDINSKLCWPEHLTSVPPPSSLLTPVDLQVFFRAGVLGQMEELRDERLSKIFSWLQSWVRGYFTRREFKKLQKQR